METHDLTNCLENAYRLSDVFALHKQGGLRVTATTNNRHNVHAYFFTPNNPCVSHVQMGMLINASYAFGLMYGHMKFKEICYIALAECFIELLQPTGFMFAFTPMQAAEQSTLDDACCAYFQQNEQAEAAVQAVFSQAYASNGFVLDEWTRNYVDDDGNESVVLPELKITPKSNYEAVKTFYDRRSDPRWGADRWKSKT